MARTANVATEYKINGLIDEQPVASGDIHIYKTALLNFDVLGYVKLGADTASEKFAGVAIAELDQATGGAVGANNIKMLRAGSNAVVQNIAITTAVTQADIDTEVYVDGDDAVDLVAGTDNDVFCGKIYNVVSANVVDIQLSNKA